MKNRAFTLIELLVVVLIIGILAAIAVPKYQTAVDKAQFANLQSLARSIKSAYDAYYQSTGEYPSSFSQLDISFSSSYQYTSYLDAESCVIFHDTYCCVGKAVVNFQSPNIICGRNDYQFGYYYKPTEYINLCFAANGNDRAQRLCKSFNYEFYMPGNIVIPYGHNDNNGNRYSLYQLK